MSATSGPSIRRRLRARIFWLHDKPLAKGEQILVRLGTREARATVIAIEKAVDPGALSSVETNSIARNHVGEIEIALSEPIAADPASDNPRTGRLVIEVNGRIAGGGLVLSVEAGRRGAVDIVPVESRARRRRTGRTLPPQRRGGLAHRPARRRQVDAGARAGAAAVHARRLADPARRRHLARRSQRRSRLLRTRTAAENIRRLAEVATHLARNGHIAIVAAVSPSQDDRAAARRIADGLFHEVYVATPAEVCEERDPKGHYAKARAGQLSGFTGTGSDYQPPAKSELTLDTSTRPVAESTDEIERLLQKSGVLINDIVDLGAHI